MISSGASVPRSAAPRTVAAALITSVAGLAALSADGLAKVPLELVEELRSATLNGNKKLLDDLILKVRAAEDAGSANALQELADNYEYDALTRLLKAACRH